MEKIKQGLPKIIKAVFWFWTFSFYAITIIEIKALLSESIGEKKIFMLLITGFLFIIHIAIYLVVMIDNIRKKYLSRLELMFCIGGIIISTIFFYAMRNNANISIRY